MYKKWNISELIENYNLDRQKIAILKKMVTLDSSSCKKYLILGVNKNNNKYWYYCQRK